MFVLVVLCIVLGTLALAATIRLIVTDDRGPMPDVSDYDSRRPLP